MPDIQVGRETYIMISTGGPALYPANTLYPADDLYPREATRIGNIVEGTMHLDELLCDGNLKFGQMCATRFEVTVYDTEDVGGKYLSVYQEDDGVFHQVFTGVVDSAKLDRLGTDRQVVAYDYAYAKSKINVASWWDNFWSTRESATLKQLRDSLLNYASVEYEDVELINDNITVTKTVNISSMPFNEMIRMICELSCCFPHFDRSGILRFYMLETDSAPTSLESLYEGENSSFEDYITQNYTGIQFYGNSSDLQYTEGTSVNPYSIQENILLYNRTNEDLHTIGANMLDYISEITYRPSNVKMILSDWQYMLGDKVSTEKGSFYVLHNAFEGMQLIEQTIEQTGSETQDEVGVETNISDLFSDTEIEDINDDIDDINDEIEDINENVGNLEIHLNRTDEGLAAEVSRATGAESSLSSRITITENGISSEVTNRQNADTSLQSQITQTPHTISMSVSGEAGKTSSAGITITLKDANGKYVDSASGNIYIDGDVIFSSQLTDGSTRISGSNIQTGTIDASRVTVTNLSADSIDTSYFHVDRYLRLNHTDRYGSNYLYLSCDGFDNLYVSTTSSLSGNASVFCGDVTCDNLAAAKSYPGKIYSPETANDTTSSAANGFVNSSTGHFGRSTASSQRYKHDITTDISEELDPHKLYDLPVKQYIYNTDYLNDVLDKRYNKPVIGFIAEDVDKIYNVASDIDSGGFVDDWNFRFLLPPMLKLIQEQHEKIQELENRIAILEEER